MENEITVFKVQHDYYLSIGEMTETQFFTTMGLAKKYANKLKESSEGYGNVSISTIVVHNKIDESQKGLSDDQVS